MDGAGCHCGGIGVLEGTKGISSSLDNYVGHEVSGGDQYPFRSLGF